MNDVVMVQGRIIGHRSNYRNEILYEMPTAEQIAALKGKWIQ